MYIDILVFGKDQEEHNPNIRAVFKQPRKKNSLNKGKCDYGKKKLEFWGMFSLKMAYRSMLTMWKVWWS